jgi:hypothetical protein
MVIRKGIKTVEPFQKDSINVVGTYNESVPSSFCTKFILTHAHAHTYARAQAHTHMRAGS